MRGKWIPVLLIVMMFSGVTAGAAWAELRDDLVGTWSTLMADTGATLTVVFGADGTFSLSAKLGILTVLTAAGTYEVEGSDAIYTIEESTDPTRVGEVGMFQDISIAGDLLTATSAEGDPMVLAREGGGGPTPVEPSTWGAVKAGRA